MKDNYQEYYLRWLTGLEKEIEYWKYFMEENGGVSFHGFEKTIASDREFELEDDIPRKCVGKEYRVLDVGAGPFSRCGKMTEKVKLDILSVDPLASVYNVMKRENDIDNGIRLETGFVELLNRKFSQNSFDMVHMSNSLDHCFDAVYGIYQLLYVCKIGGMVILRHSENEAEKAKYTGLHQWNLSVHNKKNTFLVWNNTEEYDVCENFKEYADIEIFADEFEKGGGWKYNKVVLRKKKEIELPQIDYYSEMLQYTYDYLLSRLLNDVKCHERKPMTYNELLCKKIAEIYYAPEKFIEKLKSEKIENVDIYGIGEVGTALYHLLEKCDIQINKLIDQKKKVFRGKTTIPLEAYQPQPDVSKVIVTINSGRFEVMDLLSEKLLPEYIICVDDFIK